MKLLSILVAVFAATVSIDAGAASTEDYRRWVGEIKEAPRGPFKQLRWFCEDGSVHPPKPYACSEHGGGHQHGEWSDHVRTMRDDGFYVANLLAGIDTDEYLSGAAGDDRYAQMLVERFLMGVDNGWIMRKALVYRGAIQEEDEREGGRQLLEALAGNSRWVTTRFAALRAGANLLPHGDDTASAQEVRRVSAALQNDDSGFSGLRAKIHGSPDADDAARVRDYAKSARAALKPRYEALAELIDRVYRARPLAEVLDENVSRVGNAGVQSRLRKAAETLRRDSSARSHFAESAQLLADLRDSIAIVSSAKDREILLDLSLLVEREHFSSGNSLRDQLPRMTRGEQLQLLQSSVQAIYGSGLIKDREREVLIDSIESVTKSTKPTLVAYQAFLREMGRAPGWGTQNLRFLYFESMQKLAELEPQAMLFIQDQLRGSPLLLFSNIVDGLARDANRLRGIRHKVFNDEVGTGLKALNPGLAYGVLHVKSSMEDIEEFEPNGIYLIPETVSDLPPIAGILTQGEGNPLSHVQLLARNLGIPNVSIDDNVASMLGRHDGKQVMLAVSPGGLVEIVESDNALESEQSATSGSVVIRPDPEKLRLGVTRLIPLDELRADDSGVTVGPKAAKLGGLRAAFPGAVSRGVAIPFGRFKAEVLDRPHAGGSQTVFEWMVSRYRAFETMQEPRKSRETEAFRAELYNIIANTNVSDAFRADLRAAMNEAFGGLDVGVFVRSDTNVEDLPGFTGAGLNLTLPNVVGFENLLKSIADVWASPFTKRAFAWRQSHMVGPEHVYTSILLLESVASDKSGVMVTQDLDTGDFSVLSVAVNEGLGGAVDGQAAEALRIHAETGEVLLISTATAPWRRVPAKDGGIAKLPASGADRVLQPDEIKQLITFAIDQLPVRFPPITDDSGARAAADVEFGFVDGKLRLFQIRPFLQNKSTSGSVYLREMDQSFSENKSQTVDLKQAPGK